MPILLKKNIQGLPVAERINYDFVKATTLTDLLTFFLLLFLLGNLVFLFNTELL
jgi:hypothetical protein